MRSLKLSRQKIIITSSFVFLLIAIPVTLYTVHLRTKPAVQGAATPPPVPKKINDLLKSVKEKIPIPQDEVPTVATVTDLSKLDQAFFSKAAKGDKVLMYITAKQAFLYRPSTEQVINHGTLEIIYEDPEASESATQTASASAQKANPYVLRVKF